MDDENVEMKNQKNGLMFEKTKQKLRRARSAERAKCVEKTYSQSEQKIFDKIELKYQN